MEPRSYRAKDKERGKKESKKEKKERKRKEKKHRLNTIPMLSFYRSFVVVLVILILWGDILQLGYSLVRPNVTHLTR